eukprot:764546-Alexandrium_andersonii.AAC.1
MAKTQGQGRPPETHPTNLARTSAPNGPPSADRRGAAQGEGKRRGSGRAFRSTLLRSLRAPLHASGTSA